MPRSFLLATFVFAAMILIEHAGALAAEEASPKRPNIIFIFADDMGWGDLGCYGQRVYKTPNFDRMAAEGTLFTNFYVGGSVCSPSRTAVMTGLCPARLGVHGHFSAHATNEKRGMPDYLDASVTTLPDLLKKAGYVTGHYGKWHLGYASYNPGCPDPSEYGVDEFRIAGAEWDLWSQREHSTRDIIDETLAFVRRHKDEPFYVNAWLLDTHATLNPTDEQLDMMSRFRAKGSRFHGASQIYYSVVNEVDRQIGRFFRELEAIGVADDTLVIFSSDNGPEDFQISNAAHSGIGSNGPFRGRKRSIYEGGIRVPFLVRWPGVAPAGRVDDETILGGVDFLPTLCAVAGAEVPEGLALDGLDMSAALRGEAIARPKPLTWEWRYRIFGHVTNHSPQWAIRDGRWKLLMNPDRGRVELYDIPADPREMNNLAATHPEVVERLAAQVLAWRETLPESPYDPTAGQNTYPWPGR